MKEEKYIIEVTSQELIALGAELMATKSYESKIEPLRKVCNKVDYIIQSYIIKNK